MHLAPDEARAYLKTFLARYTARDDREVWFFPTTLALEAVIHALQDHRRLLAGVQDVYWEPAGAYTGAVSARLAAAAGTGAALVGHSERRRLFGETDADTARKLRAVLEAHLAPVLCVGETLAEREAGETLAVVGRQLAAACESLDGSTLDGLTIAYEPVWAIGTGRNATPADAADVHREIRGWLVGRGAGRTRVLYGGSVNLKNITELLAEREIDGVLVGGASLDPEAWAELVRTSAP